MLLYRAFAAAVLALSIQLAAAILPQSITFHDPANRFITPNRDGKNENVAFTFYNPQYAEVSGKIYDVRGRFVADTTPASSTELNGRLVWDGRSSAGQTVATGLYIYTLKSEGQVFQGTVMVIR